MSLTRPDGPHPDVAAPLRQSMKAQTCSTHTICSAGFHEKVTSSERSVTLDDGRRAPACLTKSRALFFSFHTDVSLTAKHTV